jgi:hypothetical protein
MSDNEIIKLKRKNKKAQVGETLTWIVATLVIFGVLLIFIYASILMAKAKSMNSIKVKEHVDSLVNFDDDWIQLKSEMAFARNQENKKQIVDWINEKKLNEEEGLINQVLENENQGT